MRKRIVLCFFYMFHRYTAGVLGLGGERTVEAVKRDERRSALIRDSTAYLQNKEMLAKESDSRSPTL
jgi:hypothetical protein